MADPKRPPSVFLRMRLRVQIMAAVAFNLLFIYDLRGICIPALNCWACPIASFACPMGALQNAMPAMRATVLAPIYVLGSIFVACAIMGRSMCGWLCPFGLVQDLLARIRRHQARMPRWTGYLKYVILIVMGLILPYLTLEPVFCKFCPQGALQGGIPQPIIEPMLRPLMGTMWYIKMGILVAFLVGAIFIRRPFCHSFCALGAIFSLFNRMGIAQIRFRRDKCVDCLWCVRACPAGIDPRTDLNGMNCVGCMECAKCPFDAIDARTAFSCGGCARPALESEDISEQQSEQ